MLSVPTRNGGFLTSKSRERESRRKNRLGSLPPVFLVIVCIPPKAADFQARSADGGGCNGRKSAPARSGVAFSGIVDHNSGHHRHDPGAFCLRDLAKFNSDLTPN